MAAERRWWKFAKAFQLLPLEGRKKVTHSRKLRGTYVRISRVHPSVGGTLDDMGAPLRVHAFVAYAPDRLALPMMAGQQARFEGILDYFERYKRWPRAPEMKGIAARAEAKWMGMPLGELEPEEAPPARAEAAVDKAPPDNKETPRPATSADLPMQLAMAVAGSDPEMAEILVQLASRRRQAGSACQ